MKKYSSNLHTLTKQIDLQAKLAPFIGRIRADADNMLIIAGPCAVESEEQIFKISELVSKAGANVLRGGTFKMRTSPHTFQGLGERGLSYLKAAGEKYRLKTISEVSSLKNLDIVAKYVDILQVGTRNMHNFELLKQIGLTRKPIILKRGFAATYNEFLMAAEYILSAGNTNIILCERGIRTFETYTRNTLDIAAVPALKELTSFPIIVDPSHGTGKRSLVASMSNAAIAAGADGIMLEVHSEPENSFSDSKQTIDPITFKNIVLSLKSINEIIRNPVT